MDTNKFDITPTKEGYFGAYGGQIIPPMLKPIFDEIAEFYEKIKNTAEFKAELNYYRKHYIGRPSPIFHAKNLSEKIAQSSASQSHSHQQSRAHQGHPKPPSAQIYLKREDLNHTGAHKINHTIAEALIAKKMGKKKLIAETGAGQHGVALATAAALVQIPCEIHMGEIDIAKQAPNVTRMKMLGAKVVPVTTGTRSLKDAVDSAFNEFVKDPQNIFFGIGSVVGPHPFPMMVRDFQRIVGEEAHEQFQELTGHLPDHLVACVGGGSNAIGLFSAFLEDTKIQIHGVEPSGKNQAPNFTPGEHAATITLGTPGNLHGMHTYLLQDEKGNPQPVYSIASGLDYPGVGPQHSYLKDINRVNYVTISDTECLNAFIELSRLEGIIPALESAHAVAYAIKLAAELNKSGQQHNSILVNLSGRGDKDVDYVAKLLRII